ncbi:MAG: family 16 glycosylhydrolase [Bacteroidales bacterium]
MKRMKELKQIQKTAGTVLLVLLISIAGRLSGQEYQLVWSDEFEGDSLDLSRWSYMTGDGTAYGLPSGWGNNEEQYYLEQNAVVGDSVLTIVAKKQWVGGKPYTSARIRTLDKGDWKYCRIEFRARMPLGKGLWPAIWMLPSDNAYGGWAASGEIDIMEYLGDAPRTVHGTLHFGGEYPDNEFKGKSYVLPQGEADFHQEFHDFALEWEEGEIRWYVDGELYQTQGRGDWWSSGGQFPAPFDRRFHLLINLAVGGNWPGSPDGSTQFPQELVIDYVRVYQKNVTGQDPRSGTRPDGFVLEQNQPNPFSSSTIISYILPGREHVTLDVFDVRGSKIATLIEEEKLPGQHRIIFDAAGLSPGLYFYRFRAGSCYGIRRMLLLGDPDLIS